MAQDKRGRPPEPDVDEVLNELQSEETGDDFIAGPTARNDIGNAKRAAAKATGVMGATKKLDPDLDIDRMDDGRVKSGSSAGIHSFKEVPPEKGANDSRLTLSNTEIAEGVTTTAKKSPARPSAQTGASSRPQGMSGGAISRKRVPAPGNAVDVPKGALVRGKSPSPTVDEKATKRSARAGGPQGERPLSKGGSGER
jgi:hypothetical protein